MNWDLTLEKLRREVFRPSIPPPVRLPVWAAAAIVGAGLSLAAPACGRGGDSGSPAADMGPVHVEYGAPMPPPMEVEPLYAAPPPDEPMKVDSPPPVEEYGAPVMSETAPTMSEPVDLYGIPPMRTEAVAPMPAPPDIGTAKPAYGIPPHLRKPPPPPPMTTTDGKVWDKPAEGWD
jgi:hypothetical protein